MFRCVLLGVLALCLGMVATAEDDDRDDGLIGGAVQPRPRYEVPAEPRAVSAVVPTKHRPFAKQLTACGIILPAEDVVEDAVADEAAAAAGAGPRRRRPSRKRRRSGSSATAARSGGGCRRTSTSLHCPSAGSVP